MTTSLIVKVLTHYYPHWDPPKDRGREWIPTLCPFHGDENPSATISLVRNAFKCFACGEKGDALAIIMRKEGIGYLQALDFAERLQPGSREALRNSTARKPRRSASGNPRTGRQRDGTVRTGVCGRATPWS